MENNNIENLRKEVDSQIQEIKKLCIKNKFRFAVDREFHNMWVENIKIVEDKKKEIDKSLGNGVLDQSQQKVQKAKRELRLLSTDINGRKRRLKIISNTVVYWLFMNPNVSNMMVQILLLSLTVGTFVQGCNTLSGSSTASSSGGGEGIASHTQDKGNISRVQKLSIYFPSGEAEILEASKRELRETANRFAQRSQFCAVVISYADSTGPRPFNQDLLDGRIESVKEVIAARRPDSMIGVRGGILTAPSLDSESRKKWKSWARRADITFYDQNCDDLLASDTAYVPGIVDTTK